jgi:DNA replication and repair protein RecF
MAESGIALAEGRALTVERLNASLAARAGAFPRAHLALAGEDLLAGAIPVDDLARALAASRVRDAEAGRTGAGPHLTDLAVRHTERRMDARDCSTGEQKALLISIMLADAWEIARERGATILLLDEIAAHLDGRRRAALFDEIAALGVQAWMTGTDASLFDGLGDRAEIILVEDGRFERVP